MHESSMNVSFILVSMIYNCSVICVTHSLTFLSFIQFQVSIISITNSVQVNLSCHLIVCHICISSVDLNFVFL